MLGILVSFAYDVPTGASIVMANLALFLLFSLASVVKNYAK
jgi:ABC-type Mn2+/Zn2+ transport system permease subunit